MGGTVPGNGGRYCEHSKRVLNSDEGCLQCFMADQKTAVRDVNHRGETIDDINRRLTGLKQFNEGLQNAAGIPVSFTVKDSGARQQFESGMVRDTTEGKPTTPVCSTVPCSTAGPRW
jgi:hypothetical protein